MHRCVLLFRTVLNAELVNAAARQNQFSVQLCDSRDGICHHAIGGIYFHFNNLFLLLCTAFGNLQLKCCDSAWSQAISCPFQTRPLTGLQLLHFKLPNKDNIALAGWSRKLHVDGKT